MPDSIQNLLNELYEKYFLIKNQCFSGFATPETLKEFSCLIHKAKNLNNAVLNKNILFMVSSLLKQNICETDFWSDILQETGFGGLHSANYKLTPKKHAKNIHIGVMYHKKFEMFSNDVLYPIHLGKAISDFESEIPGDDIGDNISYKNAAYAELSGIYWIWKNIKADIKGIMHYRRFLDLKKPLDSDMYYDYVLTPDFKANEFLLKLGYTEEIISDLMSKYDIIVKSSDNIETCSNNSIASHYVEHHIQKHLETALGIIGRDYPGMYESVVKTFRGSESYFSNVFIMNSAEYDAYCSWLFDILWKVEKTINPYNGEIAPEMTNARWAGYLGERLTGAYIRKRLEDGLRVKEAPICMISEENKYWTDADTYDKSGLQAQNTMQMSMLNSGENPAVTVFVKADNAKNRCIRSLKTQTINNTEIILVNIREFSNLKKLITYAKGKYIHFMDNNDLLEKDFYKNILSNALKYDSDIAITTYKILNPLEVSISEKSILPHTLFGGGMNINSNPDILLETPQLFNKLFKKEFLLNNTQIIESKTPLEFYLRAVTCADKISVLRDAEYKHINDRFADFSIEDFQRVLDVMDKFSGEKMLNVFRNFVLYLFICSNLPEIATQSRIVEFITKEVLENKEKYGNEDKLEFYSYNSTFMNQLFKAKNAEQIRKTILENTVPLVLDYKAAAPVIYYLIQG